ncbi:MAG: hypothetical protein KDK39_04180 [Leptospiraceae bacterium]|nr:hypothetical protein [Leptospiraceae bacterium]
MRNNRRKRFAAGLRGWAAMMVLLFLVTQCGFIRSARVSGDYVEAMAPESAEECLVTWPFHAVMLPITAIIDQVIHTFEIIPEAGRDAKDYFFLRGNGNNIMLERAVFIPKTVATPLIFVLSYITRWLVPIDEDTTPFQQGDEFDETDSDS